MATEKAVIGQAQRILVDATNNIWHKISLWTHASDVEMPNGDPLNQYLTDMNDSINERFDGKYNSYNIGTTGITKLDDIPEIGYSRVQTMEPITAGDYTLGANHFFYCYSGRDSASIEKMAVMIDTTDLTSIVMYIAHYSIEARWTLTKIATQKQIDDLQMQIDELNNAFNQLNLFVNQSVGDLNARYQVIQDQMDWLEAELAELQEQLNDLLNELRDFKAEARGRLDAIDRILNGLYGPVGSLFITHSNVSPHDLFGGEWYLVKFAYLYAGDYEDGTAISAIDSREQKVDRYDFWPMFEGRESFVLDKSNLPKHLHKVVEGQYEYDASMGVKLKKKLSEILPRSFGEDIPASDGGTRGDKVVALSEDAIRRNEYGGLVWWSSVTGSNEFPNEPLAQPVDLNPLRFPVRVWMRIG